MENFSIPPDTNRGVVNTERSALRALVDWLQVTFKYTTDLTKICGLLELDFSLFSESEFSLLGYKTMFSFGTIKLLTDGSNEAEMGVHLLMSGQACREYELMVGHLPWDKLFQRIMAYGNAGGTPWYKFARLDVSVDDIRYNGEKPYFRVKKLIDLAKEGLCRSKFRKAREIDGFKLSDGSQEGYTIYFGSGKSDIQCRIYDKIYEREHKGKEIEENLTTWNRTEFQLRDERALAMALYIAIHNNIGNNLLGILKNYINFVDRNPTDDNKARWKISKFWSLFLGDVEKLRLLMVAPDKTIERSKEWLEKQTPRTIAKILLAEEYDLEYLRKIAELGLDMLTESDFKEIEAHHIKREIQRKKRDHPHMG